MGSDDCGWMPPPPRAHSSPLACGWFGTQSGLYGKAAQSRNSSWSSSVSPHKWCPPGPDRSHPGADPHPRRPCRTPSLAPPTIGTWIPRRGRPLRRRRRPLGPLRLLPGTGRPPTWRRLGPPPTATAPRRPPRARGTAGTAGTPAHARSVGPLPSPRAANAGNAAPQWQEQWSQGGDGGTRKNRAVPPPGPPPLRMRSEDLGGRSLAGWNGRG